MAVSGKTFAMLMHEMNGDERDLQAAPNEVRS